MKPSYKNFMAYQAVTPVLLFLLLPLQALAMDPADPKERPAHHTTKEFRNFPIIQEPSRRLGFDFYLKRFTSSFSSPVVPKSHFIPEESALARYRELGNENSVTWIGQSTLLIKLDGKTILTDPFFKDHAAPFNFGPKRYVEPGIHPENLPPIDIILISHNHYDHLDADFIEAIPNKQSVQVCVPLKLKPFLLIAGMAMSMNWIGMRPKPFSIFSSQLCRPFIIPAGESATGINLCGAHGR
jgi:hypothetical protein